VRDSGDDIYGLRKDRRRELHKEGWTAYVEKFLRAFEQHYRRQRAEPLPLLDPGVDPVAHIAVARVTENAPMT
jgi:hypothetical protein